MNFLTDMLSLFANVTNITWQQVVMWVIGGVLIYLAIKKNMEPTLLLPMGFGAILVNLPISGAVDRYYLNGEWIKDLAEGQSPADVILPQSLCRINIFLVPGIFHIISCGMTESES